MNIVTGECLALKQDLLKLDIGNKNKKGPGYKSSPVLKSNIL